MKKQMKRMKMRFDNFLVRHGFGMRSKLITIFLVVKVIPLILLSAIALNQIVVLGDELRNIAVSDSSQALNDSAKENIERMTTDTASKVAAFLYERDDDIRFLAGMEPTEENYRRFAEAMTGRVITTGQWRLAEDGTSWVPEEPTPPLENLSGISTNVENNDMDGFHYREPDAFTYDEIPLYDEITFVDLNGNERVKVVTDSNKTRYPMSRQLKNVSLRENTYIKAETYFPKLRELAPGDIYVSDVIGAYVGANYIGMYTPDNVDAAARDRGYDIPYLPEEQAYSGMENPVGERFEGIVRWATPVTGSNGAVIGYVTFALNHDHIMEFVDHLTPMNERYTELPNAYDGNYAFIWDYQCRSICHPRHHSIVGYDPQTGDPQIPWLETSMYDAWQASGVEKWMDYVEGLPTFDNQSRTKKPAPILTKEGLVGLDGRYLNNAPQCTGWMDLTVDGGSGSFYILWSGLYKLTTAAAIPYYTGQYAPSEANNFSRRGFGIVTIGAGLEDFTRPATETEAKLTVTIDNNLTDTSMKLIATTGLIILLVVCIAILIASSMTKNITALIAGISRFRSGERQFRFEAPVKDEFGTLADSFDDMADSIVDSVKNPLTITDMNRTIKYMNEQGLEFYDGTLDDLLGTDYSGSSVYPAGTPFDPILALEENREAEIFYAADRERYIRGNASYLMDKEGIRIGYIIETVDVTDMVLEQIKIEEQRTLLDRIFSASPDLIWYKNVKGKYMAVNPRFAAITDWEAEDIIGKTSEEVLPRAVAEELIENDERALGSGGPLYTEERIRFADRHEEILDSVRTPIRDANGALVGVLGYARNVTSRVDIENELRRTQLELEQAVNDANRANEHKGEFLARMSHEIRTPMNAIIGITNIVLNRLDETEDTSGKLGEVTAHVRQIESSSQHLLGLLNDILDISKIEAGKIELTDETVELSQLAGTVVGIIKPRCDEKNIAFVTDFDEFEPMAFRTDSLRLRQVLINLLGNAVKFTPECGTISFGIKQKAREAGKTLVEFTVRDNGIGIAPEVQEQIFQPFEQAGSGITRQYGGTGLGLAISRRIVEMFGGQLAVESAVGHGSNFYFTIWMQETESDLPQEQAISDATDQFAGKRALLVDDVDINRMIVMSLLEATGLEIDEAADGLEAVKLFEGSEPGRYDIILMDVKMPNMDGYEASRVIRAMNRPDAASVPIIALTANAFKDDIDTAIANGMNDHLAKPVEQDTLLKMLFRYLRPKQ
ncbi:response regulator [Ruminococcaceae bacterium OttesenSCG-928-L11]|nr:response regulator [Ruminococcaceae bacterium OttesenSCG-928-L11]